MKENWTYRKLGDKCCILYGYPFNSKLFSSSNEGMPLIRIRDVKEGNTSTYYLGDYPKEYIIHKGDFLIGMDGEFNISSWKSEDALLNQRVCKIECKCSDILIRYVYRFLTQELKKNEDETPFVTVKHLSAKKLNQIIIPVPPLSIQERIVSELDLLSGIIVKKKEQLKEYEQLAQAIFYDMFGDPATNEKGWEVKKLGEVCESDLGKTLNSSKDKGVLHPYLCAVNVLWNKIDLSILKQTRFEESELERYSVKKGDLLVCEGGDIGRAAIWDKEENIQYQNALHRIRFKGNILPRYCLMVLYSLKENGILDNRYGKGVTIKHLVKSSLLSIPISLPPLSLQQKFAEKIEAIEKQKALTKQSIQETETLFNSRMDYYFG